ncbi:unnamed protein product [Prorocentrum cordatum]|uniref:RRM domain-containing protein n=1 Tax=Prorocentrum cordatum TaxID=2364126 RepID=A0ABN9QFY5_9DINO|nr:unnamed protein product [Polarella glacialis]
MDYTARVQRIQHFAAQVSHKKEMTLFVDNVGPDCSKSQVLSWLDSNGFQDTYDYIYVPRCFHTRKSTGQMFINFFVMDAINEFIEAVIAADFGAGRALRVQLFSCVRQDPPPCQSSLFVWRRFERPRP